MAYFLQREPQGQDQRVGGRSAGGRPPPAPAPWGGQEAQGGMPGGCPGSPLSRLVSDGYAGGPGRSSSQQGFDAGVAQQWNSSVQETQANHLQQNDPNFALKAPKSHGYRVSQAPGGGSSLSLGWDAAPGGGVDPIRRGRSGSVGMDQRAYGGGQSSYQSDANGAGGNYRAPSPSASCAAGGRRGASREPNGGMGAVFGGGQSYDAPGGAMARAPSPSMRGQGLADAAYASRGPPGGGGGQYGGGQYGGGPPQQSQQTSLAFGQRDQSGSSNAYASGGNQNCGNGITDRRTTRVLQAPGGNSQISFG